MGPPKLNHNRRIDIFCPNGHRRCRNICRTMNSSLQRIEFELPGEDSDFDVSYAFFKNSKRQCLICLLLPKSSFHVAPLENWGSYSRDDLLVPGEPTGTH